MTNFAITSTTNNLWLENKGDGTIIQIHKSEFHLTKEKDGILNLEYEGKSYNFTFDGAYGTDIIDTIDNTSFSDNDSLYTALKTLAG